MSLGSEAKEEQLIADALYEQEQIVKKRAGLQKRGRRNATAQREIQTRLTKENKMKNVIRFEGLKPLTHCDFKGVDKPPSTEMFKTMCQGMHPWDITTKGKEVTKEPL